MKMICIKIHTCVYGQYVEYLFFRFECKLFPTYSVYPIDATLASFSTMFFTKGVCAAYRSSCSETLCSLTPTGPLDWLCALRQWLELPYMTVMNWTYAVISYIVTSLLVGLATIVSYPQKYLSSNCLLIQRLFIHGRLIHRNSCSLAQWTVVGMTRLIPNLIKSELPCIYCPMCSSVQTLLSVCSIMTPSIAVQVTFMTLFQFSKTTKLK